MTRHGGSIRLNDKTILDGLRLTGGKIHFIGRLEECFDTIAITIEHPDLPEIVEGGMAPEINITSFTIQPIPWVRLAPRRVWLWKFTEACKAFWKVISWRNSKWD